MVVQDGIGDDHVGIIELGVVDPEHHGLIDVIVGRHGQDDALGSGIDVLLERLTGAEHARRLDHHIDGEVLPGECGRVSLHQHGDAVAARGHDTVGDLDLLPERPHDRVVLEEISQDLVVGKIVDGNNLDTAIAAAQRRS